MHHCGEREVERPQAQDRHDVRGIDDKGIGGDREDGWHAVHREHQIRQIDHHQRQEQRGDSCHHLAGLLVRHFDEEMLGVKLGGDPHVAGDPTHRRVLGKIGLVIAGPEHFDAGIDQEGGENVQHPVSLIDQRRTRRDHDPAQHDDCYDTPQQRTVLVLLRDREEGENQADDEDIVDRQRLFDEEPGIVLHTEICALLDPDPDPEG